MYHAHAVVRCLYTLKQNKFPLASYPTSAICVLLWGLSCRAQNYGKGPATRRTSSVKGHYNHLDRSNVRDKGWEHPCFKGGEVFICTSFHFTKHVWTRGNLSIWLVGDRYVGIPPFLFFGTESAASAL